MRDPEVLLAKQPEAPLEVARQLVLRFSGDPRFPSLARRWCERASAEGVGATGGTFTANEVETLAVLILMEATTEPQTLHALFLEAARKEYNESRSSRSNNTFHLLLGLIDLWRQRACSAAELASAMITWAQRSGNSFHARGAALSLYEYHDIAYDLLGPVPKQVEQNQTCGSCGKVHFQRAYSVLEPFLALRLRRADRRCEPVSRDEDVLRQLPSGLILGDELLIRPLRRLVDVRLEIPTHILEAAEQARSAQEWAPFLNALLLLFAVDSRRDATIERFAAWIAEQPRLEEVLSNDPARSLLNFPWSGVFTGRGFARDARPRKLLPASRAFLRRGLWPTKLWTQWLNASPQVGSHDDPAIERNLEEAAMEATREILGDALLSFFLNAQERSPVRIAALEAIELLSPGGDGSIIRALLKVETKELRTRAKQVQSALKKRSLPLDAELGIQDACEFFLPLMQARGSGQ
jgi:hypothetical protein